MVTVSPGRTIAASNWSQSFNVEPRLRRVRTSYAVPFPALCAMSVKSVSPSGTGPYAPEPDEPCASPRSTQATAVRSHQRNAMVTAADTSAARIATPHPEFNQSTAMERPT